MRRSTAALACLLLVAPASRSARADCDDLRGSPIVPQVDWETQVKPLLNTLYGGRCSGCHFPGRFPDLTDTGIDAIYKIVGSYVVPGDPLTSGLFDKVNCDPPALGERMPLDGAPLTPAEQGLIYDWIAQGASGEPGTPIERRFIFRDGAESRRWYPQ